MGRNNIILKNPFTSMLEVSRLIQPDLLIEIEATAIVE